MELLQAATRVLVRCSPSLSLYSAPLYRNPSSPFALRSFTTTCLLRQDQPGALRRQLRQEEQDTRSSHISASPGEDAATTPAPAPAPAPAPTFAERRSETPSMMELMDSILDGPKGIPSQAQQRPSRYPVPSAPYQNGVRPASQNSMIDFNQFMSANKQDIPVQRDLSPVKDLNFSLGPTLGKTVKVNTSGDVGRAFRQVDALCNRNKVRYDFNKQRFHERPGLKRKRLHSERWRRRFKEAFRGTVKMVNKMRKQGW